MGTPQQDAWVLKVLGVAQGAAAGPMVSAAELLARFNDAKEEVDAGLSNLQAALRRTGDEDMERIANYGMYGMTNGAGVGLMKALFELRSASPETRATLGAKARAAAVAYKKAVFEHPLVDLVDRNPFKVPVGIRAKLGPALDAIARSA